MTDGEDEGIVDSKTRALGLCDVEIMTLGVGCGVPREELVWGVHAGVDDGKGEGERVRVVLD